MSRLQSADWTALGAVGVPGDSIKALLLGRKLGTDIRA